jgi:membrane-bound lytic murein transglycosylase A
VPEKDYSRTLAAGQSALRKIVDPARLPDFTRSLDQRDDLLGAVENSLHYLAKPSSRGFFPTSGIGHQRVVRSLEAFRDLLRSDLPSGMITAQLRQRFDVYESVGCDDKGTVLFTGYYTPIFRGSMVRTEEFRYPLHRLPKNHVKDPLTGKTQGRRQPDGSVDPSYPDRAELLASGDLDGLELVYLANAFEAYVIGVQGSAILELEEGGRLEVGYAGNNGHAYSSLGMALVNSGKLRKDELNLRNLILYFQDHPSDYDSLAALNARYVFFQEGDGGPFGCLNEPVLAMRSIATDKSIFPRGALCWLETKLPVSTGTTSHFVLDQDAGGAIRAPGRCDVYMGVGEEAGELAGHTFAEGRLCYLLLKD